jgi:hypothetical protein
MNAGQKNNERSVNEIGPAPSSFRALFARRAQIAAINISYIENLRTFLTLACVPVSMRGRSLFSRAQTKHTHLQPGY